MKVSPSSSIFVFRCGILQQGVLSYKAIRNLVRPSLSRYIHFKGACNTVMRSSSLRCSPAVLVAILTVFSAAQQSESLGDAARRLRSEKQSPSSPTTRQGDTSGGDLASQTASQAFAGPVSKLDRKSVV